MSCPRCNAPAADETLREFGGVCPKCLLDFSEEQDAPAFPNLEIVEMVGQGGMGVVYKAVQRNLGRTVALKVLSPHLSADPEFVERFTREARALASLSHPNIVGIYDSGIHDHVPYLVMEYVDGTPLRKMLASKKLTPERVLEVIPQICDALHYAHAHGVVHRDIKPENILVDREGRVRIADFGLAKLASLDETRITRTGYVMGSPHYMAPEQFANSGRVDHRADIYSLGVVFYEMLTGEVPMGRFKPPSEKAAVDQRLDPVVLKSLEREPDDRWQTVEEVKARVAGLDAPPDARTTHDRSLRIAIAFCTAIAVLAVVVVLWLSKKQADDSAGGPVLVAVAGVVTLIAMAGPLRGSRWKRIEAPTRARRQALVVGIAAGALVFIAIGILLFSTAPAPQAPKPAGTPGRTIVRMINPAGDDRFLLRDAWPHESELPSGLRYESLVEGEEVFRESTSREGQPRWQDMMADVSLIRRATLADGRVSLFGVQFKTEYARMKWEKTMGFVPVSFRDGRDPLGLSLFHVTVADYSRNPGATAAYDLLLPVLQRKMEEAAEKLRSRP